MRQVLVMAVFMLATVVWTIAQQPSAGGGQSTSSQTPSAGQSQSSASHSAGGQGAQSPDSAQSSGSAQSQGSSQSGAGSQSQSSQTPSAGGQGQSSTTPGSAGQGSAQTPGSTQTPGSAQTPGQSSAQSGAATPGEGANATVTEGCLGGSSPNFTITDSAGTTYKLNIPAGADASPLASHIGESVQVMGHVNKGSGTTSPSTIDATRIGRGTGNCQASNSKQPKS